MTNYEINEPIIRDLKLENGVKGVAKQILFGNIRFIYLNITLSIQLPQWAWIVSGIRYPNVETFNKNIDGVGIQIKPSANFIQTTQTVNAGTRIVTSLFYVIP